MGPPLPDKRDTPKVRAYIARQPVLQRRRLRELQRAIKGAVRGLDDAISYSIPAVKLGGRVVVWYAAWREHVSIYPLTGGFTKANAKQLARFEVSKGTLRFPLDAAPPAGLVKKLVKSRAADVRARLK